MLKRKQKRNEPLDPLRRAAEVVGLLISVEVAIKGGIDLVVKILDLLHF
jgi:hypothetical protein